MKKVVIGISGSLIIDSSGNFPGYKRSYVNDDYIDSVIQNGGIPFIIPFNEDKEVIKEQVKLVDAIILSGGHDVSPSNYNQEPSPKLGGIFPERDDFDFNLLECAMEEEKPILGICRGMQIINTYFKGSLYQDMSEIKSELVKHDQVRTPSLAIHTVEIKEDSKLREILKTDEIMVNSFHHQAVKELGFGFKAVAFAKDGVIEAIEKDDYPFLMGIQWHPEMLHRSLSIMNNIFKALIEKSKEKKDDK